MGKLTSNFLLFIFIILMLVRQSRQRLPYGKLWGSNINFDDSYGKFTGAGDVIGTIQDSPLSPMIDDSFLQTNTWRRPSDRKRSRLAIIMGRSFSKAGGTDGWYYGSSLK